MKLLGDLKVVFSIFNFIQELIFILALVWNGPMGLFEIEKFKHGSVSLLESITKSTKAVNNNNNKIKMIYKILYFFLK